ncbi:MAG TPA: Ku protein [Bryobacteraceae bacterium]|nr:Ku protein [Bryobacteraceae bacterium]
MASTVWKGFISFGLVSFPVRLQVAAREKSIQFHLLHKKDLSRVKEVYFCQAEDKRLKREDLVKGYEVSKNEYVVVEPEELDKIAPQTAKTMDIVQFVKAEDFDPVYLDKSYHVLPDGDVTKPYALFREAMKQRGQYAIAKVAMHNREHVTVIRPDGNELMLHTMFFVNEIQQVEVKTGSEKFSAQELKLAGQLIDTLTSKFDPEKFHDEYQANVARLIEQKQKGERVTAVKTEKPPRVVNILDALRKSLAENKSGEGAKRQAAKPRTKSRKRRAA